MTTKRRRATEAEKATTAASERFMTKPVLLELLAKTVTTYTKIYPFDALYALHAVRDTANVLIAKRTDEIVADRQGEIDRLRAEQKEE